MIIKEVILTKADKQGNESQVKVMLGYCFATEISYKILAEEDINDFIRVAIECINKKKMPDTRKSIFLIMAAMQSYYESIGKKTPLTDKDLMYHMKVDEMGTAVGTIIAMYIEANKSPKDEVDEQEKKESGEQKNV